MKTFKEQYDKLTEAYIHNKVDPYDACACFIGNLLGGEDWNKVRRFEHFGESTPIKIPKCYPAGLSQAMRDEIRKGTQFIATISDNTYTVQEIIDMENLFIKTLEEAAGAGKHWPSMDTKNSPNYEEALFEAFCATLDLLKEIHQSKGEQVDEFLLTRRKLSENAVQS